jgi:hypothetical protein
MKYVRVYDRLQNLMERTSLVFMNRRSEISVAKFKVKLNETMKLGKSIWTTLKKNGGGFVSHPQ